MSSTRVFGSAVVVCLLVLWTSQAYAWHLRGCVFCDVNQNGVIDEDDTLFPGATITIVGSGGNVITGDAGSDACFNVNMPDEPDTYTATLDAESLPDDAVVVIPEGGVLEFELTNDNQSLTFDWLFDSAVCRGLCWMTGGGVKFESVTGTWNAENENGGGPKDSVGGVVFPSCSQFPSNGGQWNHVAHSLKLHLIGQDITVLRCGNVEGIEPGTESPVCPVNFIEFRGTGRLQGIKGNKMDDLDVMFFGRVEDRNEPGNEQSANSGEDIDRYFLRVMDADGNLHILVDEDGDPTTVDPLTITGGNFQIHCTSCDDGDGGGASLDFVSSQEPGNVFLRGDSNTDSDVDVSDIVFTMSYLFSGGSAPRCEDAADANGDGRLNISDGVYTMSYLFRSGPSMPAPFPEPWLDPVADSLTCDMRPVR